MLRLRLTWQKDAKLSRMPKNDCLAEKPASGNHSNWRCPLSLHFNIFSHPRRVRVRPCCTAWQLSHLYYSLPILLFHLYSPIVRTTCKQGGDGVLCAIKNSERARQQIDEFLFDLPLHPPPSKHRPGYKRLPHFTGPSWAFFITGTGELDRRAWIKFSNHRKNGMSGGDNSECSSKRERVERNPELSQMLQSGDLEERDK